MTSANSDKPVAFYQEMRRTDSLPPYFRHAVLLAELMRLGGARVQAGDILHALDVLDLTLDRADQDGPGPRELFEANTEARSCACGGDWARRTDERAADVGWWHLEAESDSPGGRWITRKCPKGGRAPKPEPRRTGGAEAEPVSRLEAIQIAIRELYQHVNDLPDEEFDARLAALRAERDRELGK